MFFRVIAGFVGFLMGLGFIAGLESGELSPLMGCWIMLLGAAFLVYAIGGNDLVKRIIPFLGEE